MTIQLGYEASELSDRPTGLRGEWVILSYNGDYDDLTCDQSDATIHVVDVAMKWKLL